VGQEDFLKRQFDQLGKALGRILANLMDLKDKGETIEALEVTDRALKKELGMDIDQLLAIPEERFVHLFNEHEKLNIRHLDKFGDIFYQLAELLDQKESNAERKRSLYQRSTIIYEYLNETRSVYSLEKQFLITRIRKILGKN